VGSRDQSAPLEEPCWENCATVDQPEPRLLQALYVSSGGRLPDQRRTLDIVAGPAPRKLSRQPGPPAGVMSCLGTSYSKRDCQPDLRKGSLAIRPDQHAGWTQCSMDDTLGMQSSQSLGGLVQQGCGASCIQMASRPILEEFADGGSRCRDRHEPHRAVLNDEIGERQHTRMAELTDGHDDRGESVSVGRIPD
jgi:hypothetical protein